MICKKKKKKSQEIEEAIRTRYNASQNPWKSISIVQIQKIFEKLKWVPRRRLSPLFATNFSQVSTFRPNDRNISSVKLTKETNHSSINVIAFVGTESIFFIHTILIGGNRELPGNRYVYTSK